MPIYAANRGVSMQLPVICLDTDFAVANLISSETKACAPFVLLRFSNDVAGTGFILVTVVEWRCPIAKQRLVMKVSTAPFVKLPASSLAQRRVLVQLDRRQR